MDWASRRIETIIGLAALISFGSAVNLWLVYSDTRPQGWDFASYLATSARVHYAIQHGSMSDLIATLSDPYRPPLLALTSQIFYTIFGLSYESAMLTNVFFLAILVVSTYLLAKYMSNSSRLGLLRAGVVVTLPGVIVYARVFGLDLPTTALVPLALYLALASDGFRKRGFALALGTVLGLGLLAKWSYFVFVAPTILAELFQNRSKISYCNVVLGSIVALAIASPWYISALGQGLIARLLFFAVGSGASPFAPYGNTNLFDFQVIMFYPMGVFYKLIGLYYVITLDILLAIFGLAVLRNEFQGFALRSSLRSLGLSVATGLLVFTLLLDKAWRFILPTVPVLLVLAVSIAWKIRIQRIRLGPMLLLGTLIGGSVLTVVGLWQPAIGKDLGIYSSYDDWTRYHAWVENFPPVHDDWKVPQIVQLIGSLNPRATVAVLAAHWVFSQDTLSYYALMMGYESVAFTDFREEIARIPYYGNLSRYDFTLMKTGDVGSLWLTSTLSKVLKELQNPNNPFYARNRLIQSFGLPDGSTLYVFTRSDQTTPIASCPICTEAIDHRNPASSRTASNDIQFAMSSRGRVFRSILRETSVILVQRTVLL